MDLQQLDGADVRQLNTNATQQQPIIVQAPEPPIATTQNVFAPIVTKEAEPVTIDKATEKANEVVSEVFGQAVLHTVTTDKDVQKQLLDTAKQVVTDKASTIADKASAESIAQNFLKHEDACNYFGYDEKTTTKFHVKMMAAWVFVINTIYIFTIGGLIVAPISFILHKLRVIIKKQWLSILLAIIIYLMIALLPLLIAWLTGLMSPTDTPEVTSSLQGILL